MPRTFVDASNVRISPASFCTVRAEMYSGEVFEELEPRRLFPATGPEEFISLLDSSGTERMIVRSIDSLDADSAAAVRACLADYYRIPIIEAINSFEDKSGIIKFSVVTNYGPCTFTVRNRHADIKLLVGKRVMMKDAADNRYEIPDYHALDKKSIHILAGYL